MLTSILILYFFSFAFFIFYHFKYGIPDEFAAFRIYAKYIFVLIFWLIFIYSNYQILAENSYSRSKGDFQQNIYIQNDNLEMDDYLFFLRNRSLNYKSDKPHYKWNFYYSSKYYFLPSYIAEDHQKVDSLSIMLDTSIYDRFIIGFAGDTVNQSTVVLQKDTVPYMLFPNDFRELNITEINLDMTAEINYFLLFIVAFLASIYHIINLKLSGSAKYLKYALFSIVIIWSGFNIFILVKLLHEYYFVWHDVGIF